MNIPDGFFENPVSPEYADLLSTMGAPIYFTEAPCCHSGDCGYIDCDGVLLHDQSLFFNCGYVVPPLNAQYEEVQPDLIITGRQAIDGDTAQVGPQIAVHLGLPVISYAEDIKVEGDSVVVKRQYEDRYHVVKAKMPCLITALSELNEPRYMTPGGIFDAFDKEVTVWGRADLKDVDDSDLGLKGSPTKIAKASDKVPKGAGEKVNLDPTESVNYLMEKFKEKHII